jgi:signal transduction histidine kinase
VGPDDEIGAVARAVHEMALALERQRQDRFGFLAAVAHDLRNPLAVLKLTAQSIAREEVLEEDRARQGFALVGRQVEALNRMTSDLLDAARLEAGKLELRRTERDLRTIVKAAVELYHEAAPPHDLRACFPDQPVPLSCDHDRIAQVLNNLVSNAIKYSPEGSRVEVSLVQTPDHVEVIVADEGDGIALEDRDFIFQPFRRLSSAKYGASGAGLGLAIARRIAVAHGGSLDVDSSPGKGSTFTLRLPLLVPPDPAC